MLSPRPFLYLIINFGGMLFLSEMRGFHPSLRADVLPSPAGSPQPPVTSFGYETLPLLGTAMASLTLLDRPWGKKPPMEFARFIVDNQNE